MNSFSESFRFSVDVDESAFVRRLSELLSGGGAGFHSAVTTAVTEQVATTLGKYQDSGRIRTYKIKTYPYPDRDVHSIKDAVVRNHGYKLWYFEVVITTDKNVILTEENIEFPKVLELRPINYGSGVERFFSIKLVKQKTQNSHSLNILTVLVPDALLRKVFELTSRACDCAQKKLVAFISRTWDWHLHFICSGCGKKYICQCFKAAFTKQALLDENWKKEQPENHLRSYQKRGWPARMTRSWGEEPEYRDGICHLCTGTPSELRYCHEMYGSSFKVKYGPYIVRNSVEKGIDERAAENEIREVGGVPKIGEGWIGETELYNSVCFILGPEHPVTREASPEWLGRLRLDIYVPSLNLAIEYHGEQHFKAIEHFGGEEAFARGVARDKIKAKLCRMNGIKLVVFKHSENLNLQAVREKILSKT